MGAGLRWHPEEKGRDRDVSRVEILRRLQAGGVEHLAVVPLEPVAIGDGKIDLRLSGEFVIAGNVDAVAVDLWAEESRSDRTWEPVSVGRAEPLPLRPGQSVLATTLEYIEMPYDVSGQVVIRSVFGRVGLVAATAVQVQCGFRGRIGLELVNLGQTRIHLEPGSRVASLVLGFDASRGGTANSGVGHV